jgi:hypothetical protein
MIIDHRDRLLLVTLESARLRANVHPVAKLRSWLDSWRGIGAVERGMARQGYGLQLTRHDERGWRATFYVMGIEHSLTADTASAWEPTSWRVVQSAGAGGATEGHAQWLGRLTGCAFDIAALNRPRLVASRMEVIALSVGGPVADFDRTFYLISRDHDTAHSARSAAPASPEKCAPSVAQRQPASQQLLAGFFAEETIVRHWSREYAAPSSLAQ